MRGAAHTTERVLMMTEVIEAWRKRLFCDFRLGLHSDRGP